VQVVLIKHTLKPPGTKLLKQKNEKLVSNFAFNFNLHRYTEAASAGRGAAPVEGSAIAKAVAGWAAVPGGTADGEESMLLGWLRRWLNMRHSPGVYAAVRSHAQAVVLQAAANSERAAAASAAAAAAAAAAGNAGSQQNMPRTHASASNSGAGAVPLSDATLEDGANAAAAALLSHAAAAGLLAGGASRASILDYTAAAAAAAAAGAPPRAAGDPVGRLLDAARDLRLERAVLAPPPNGPLPGGAAEYGGDFLYNATWVEAGPVTRPLLWST